MLGRDLGVCPEAGLLVRGQPRGLRHQPHLQHHRQVSVSPSGQERPVSHAMTRDPTTWLGDNRPRYDAATQSLRYRYLPGDRTVFFWSLPKIFKGDFINKIVAFI